MWGVEVHAEKTQKFVSLHSRSSQRTWLKICSVVLILFTYFNFYRLFLFLISCLIDCFFLSLPIFILLFFLFKLISPLDFPSQKPYLLHFYHPSIPSLSTASPASLYLLYKKKKKKKNHWPSYHSLSLFTPSKIDLKKNVWSSMIHNRPKRETAQISINWQINKLLHIHTKKYY